MPTKLEEKPKRSSRRLAWMNLVSGSFLLVIGLSILGWILSAFARGTVRPGWFVASVLILQGWTFARVSWTYLGDLRRNAARLAAVEPVATATGGMGVTEAEHCPRCGDLVPEADRVCLPDGLALCRGCLRAAGGADYVAWLQARPRPEDVNVPGLAPFLSLVWFEAVMFVILGAGTAIYLVQPAGGAAATAAPASTLGLAVCVGLVFSAGVLALLRLCLASARVSLEEDRIQTRLGRFRTRGLAYDDIEDVVPEQGIVYGPRPSMFYLSWPEGYHPALRIHFYGPQGAHMLTSVQLMFEYRMRTRARAAGAPLAGRD